MNGTGEGNVSAIERALWRIKAAWMSVLFICAKDTDWSASSVVISEVVSLLQLLVVPIHVIMEMSLRNHAPVPQTALSAVQLGLSVVNPDDVASVFGRTVWLTLFVIALVWVTAYVVMILVVSWTTARKNAKHSPMLLRTLRSVAKLSTTSLFLPFVSLLLSSLSCNGSEWFGSAAVGCYGAVHAPIAALVLLDLPLFIIASSSVASVYIDRNPASDQLDARSHGRSDVLLIFVKITLSALLSFVKSTAPAWVLLVVMAICGGAWLVSFAFYVPFASIAMNAAYVGQATCFLWVVLCATIVTITNASMDVGLLVIMGTPMALLLGFIAAYTRFSAIARSPDPRSLRNMWHIILWTRERLREAFETREAQENAVSSAERRRMKSSSASSAAAASVGPSDEAARQEAEGLRGIETLEELFPESGIAHSIASALYSATTQTSHYKERQALNLARAMSTAFDIDFFFFQALQNMQQHGHSESDAGGGVAARTMSVVDRILFEQHKRTALEAEAQCYEVHVQLMKHVASRELDMGYIHADLGAKLEEAMRAARANFDAMLRINPDSPEALQNAGRFLLELAGQSQRAGELLQRARRLEDASRREKERKMRHVPFGGVSEDISPTDEQNAIITISTDRSRLGEIVAVNLSATRMLGNSSLVGSNINVIIPSPIAEMHDRFLLRFVQTGTSSFLDSTRLLFALHALGHIFPVRFRLFETPPSADDMRPKLTGVISPINSDEGYVIIGDEGYEWCILAACQRTAMTLERDVQAITAGTVPAAVIFPELFGSAGQGGQVDNDIPAAPQRSVPRGHPEVGAMVAGMGGACVHAMRRAPSMASNILGREGDRKTKGAPTVVGKGGKDDEAASAAVPGWLADMPPRLLVALRESTSVNLFVPAVLNDEEEEANNMDPGSGDDDLGDEEEEDGEGASVGQASSGGGSEGAASSGGSGSRAGSKGGLDAGGEQGGHTTKRRRGPIQPRILRVSVRAYALPKIHPSTPSGIIVAWSVDAEQAQQFPPQRVTRSAAGVGVPGSPTKTMATTAAVTTAVARLAPGPRASVLRNGTKHVDSDAQPRTVRIAQPSHMSATQHADEERTYAVDTHEAEDKSGLRSRYASPSASSKGRAVDDEFDSGDLGRKDTDPGVPDLSEPADDKDMDARRGGKRAEPAQVAPPSQGIFGGWPRMGWRRTSAGGDESEGDDGRSSTTRTSQSVKRSLKRVLDQMTQQRSVAVTMMRRAVYVSAALFLALAIAALVVLGGWNDLSQSFLTSLHITGELLEQLQLSFDTVQPLIDRGSSIAWPSSSVNATLWDLRTLPEELHNTTQEYLDFKTLLGGETLEHTRSQDAVELIASDGVSSADDHLASSRVRSLASTPVEVRTPLDTLQDPLRPEATATTSRVRMSVVNALQQLQQSLEALSKRPGSVLDANDPDVAFVLDNSRFRISNVVNQSLDDELLHHASNLEFIRIVEVITFGVVLALTVLTQVIVAIIAVRALWREERALLGMFYHIPPKMAMSMAARAEVKLRRHRRTAAGLAAREEDGEAAEDSEDSTERQKEEGEELRWQLLVERLATAAQARYVDQVMKVDNLTEAQARAKMPVRSVLPASHMDSDDRPHRAISVDTRPTVARVSRHDDTTMLGSGLRLGKRVVRAMKDMDEDHARGVRVHDTRCTALLLILLTAAPSTLIAAWFSALFSLELQLHENVMHSAIRMIDVQQVGVVAERHAQTLVGISMFGTGSGNATEQERLFAMLHAERDDLAERLRAGVFGGETALFERIQSAFPSYNEPMDPMDPVTKSYESATQSACSVIALGMLEAYYGTDGRSFDQAECATAHAGIATAGLQSMYGRFLSRSRATESKLRELWTAEAVLLAAEADPAWAAAASVNSTLLSDSVAGLRARTIELASSVRMLYDPWIRAAMEGFEDDLEVEVFEVMEQAYELQRTITIVLLVAFAFLLVMFFLPRLSWVDRIVMSTRRMLLVIPDEVVTGFPVVAENIRELEYALLHNKPIADCVGSAERKRDQALKHFHRNGRASARAAPAPSDGSVGSTVIAGSSVMDVQRRPSLRNRDQLAGSSLAADSAVLHGQDSMDDTAAGAAVFNTST